MRITLALLVAGALSLPALAQSWIPVVELIPSDARPSEQFGDSIALTGDQVLVGATNTDEMFVFERVGESWVQRARVRPADPLPAGKAFGVALAAAGDLAIVGAMRDATLGDGAGAAYVFRRTAGAWVQERKLRASDGGPFDLFGSAVALNSEFAVVGAPWGADPHGNPSGAAYVFRRAGGVWLQDAKPLADELEASDNYGSSVAISGDRILIGAPGDDDVGLNFGAAYIFRRVGETWVREAKLLPDPDAPGGLSGIPSFGWGCALSPDWAIVVGDREAYFFRRDGVSWVRHSKFALFGNPYLGASIDGDRAVINLFDNYDQIDFTGSAYVLRLVGDQWVQEARVRQPDFHGSARFGRSAALANGILAVGASRAGPFGAGAAYVYSLCAADLDGDGIVDFADYLALLGLFEATDPRVDFNNDGAVDFGDYLEFLNLFDAGC